MKKRLLVFLFLTAVALSGCKADKQDKSAAVVTGETENDTEEPINFGIRVSEVKSDEYNMSVLCEVSCPKMDELGGALGFRNIEVFLPENMDMSYGSSCEIEGMEDGILKLRLKFTFEDKIQLGTYQLRFTDFGYEKNNRFIPTVEGTWTNSCIIGGNSESVKLDLGNTAMHVPTKKWQYGESNYSLTSCGLTQTYMVINYKSDDGNTANIRDVYVNFKDGTALEASRTTDKTGYMSSDTGEGRLVINFADMINLEEAESVSIGGRTFSLKG